MNHIAAIPDPRRIGPVEPDLLASAIFLFAEYLRRLEQDSPDIDDEAEDAATVAAKIDTTLNLYMRVTALYRLLSASPTLASIALDNEEFGGALRDDALIAAAKLDVYVRRAGEDGSADFDPKEFREALDDDL